MMNGPVYARISGSYFGADLINTNGSFIESYKSDNTNGLEVNQPRGFSDNGFGVGLHYSYAVNTDGIFVAPGFIFEQNNLKITGDGNSTAINGNPESQRLEVTNRYGIKLDIGADLIGDFAVYATGGYAGISYQTKNFSDVQGNNTSLRDGTTASLFYGAGLKFNYAKNASIHLEYNEQKFTADTSTYGSINNLISEYNAKLQIAKVGLSFRF